MGEENTNLFEEKKKGFGKKGMILSIIAGVIVIIAAVAFSSGGKIKIDDFVEYEITGCDGHGVCHVRFDDEDLIRSLIQDGKLKNSNDIEFMWGAYDDILRGFDEKVEPNENLKNGDIVTITITPEEDLKDVYGLKFQEYKEKVKVTDLPEAIELDIKSQFKPVIKGISPNGKLDTSIYYEYDIDGRKFPYSISSENKQDIANGDEITIDVSGNLPEGYVFKEEQFKVKVKDLPEYVLSDDQITDEEKAQVLESATNYINDSRNYKGLFTGVKIYTESSKDTDSRDYVSSSSIEKIRNENIKFSEATIYNNGNVVETLIPFECDCTPTLEVGQLHVYGFIKFQDIYHGEDGKFKYNLFSMSNLYIDEDDRNDVRQKMLVANDITLCEQYTIHFQ